ncbi:hypothetical protein ACSBR2_000630 [Camellia fascicularis]
MGAFYAKKDYDLAKHPDVDVPNLQNLSQFVLPSEIVPNTLKRTASPIPAGGCFGGDSPGDRSTSQTRVRS